ncbi:malate:Na+ symporter [Peribacillus simplex]|uniref:2-hydroxycarboxylate transporter family protein n=1 Tax=Peribacillus TaxID=2675229 RepID=UPI0024E1E3FE|nr:MULTISPECIES: 2-hydroxycarboxylate transporter family protein [Peribacillus]MDF9760926.1 malate:Na+ symporter [Peribacillus simplex]MDV7763780.1 2-hydroxycarboxylate transporter family protein [Peribacillus sp. CSMR9]
MKSAKKMKPLPYIEEKGDNQSFLSKLKEVKVGVIPLPLYIALALIIYGASVYNQLPPDMIGGFAVIMVMGILLGDIGLKIPIVKDIGGPAILALLIPSIMVFYNLVNPAAMEAVTTLMKTSNFLYLYISCLVAGSILGMNRQVLLQGFTRMFVPLVVGTLVSVAAGVLVGSLLGYDLKHTFFFIVVPIIGGGIGEGILPLSLAYSQILGASAETFVSQMIPAAVIGNIIAIICAGLLKRLGEKKPELTGNGVLVKTKGGDGITQETNINKPVDFSLMGAGLLIACGFFIFGSLAHKFLGIPGPVLMIVAATLVKCLKVMPAKMEQGAYHLYKFISTSLTWPLMVGLGMLYIPLEDVVKIITPAYVLVCSVVVITMVGTGYVVGKFMNMYPVDSAIVTGCHSGLGGTGDVAILSASNRMSLMPFAQVSTRLGGAATVILATLLMKLLS